MKVSTARFGNLQIDPRDVLTFSEGILGFENLTRFFIVDPDDQTLIMWLQSFEDGSVAFPIIEPQVFQPKYTVDLLPSELRSLELEDMKNTKTYVILTIPQRVVEMSANLKAPILINSSKNIARQIVLQDNKLSVRHEMYKELKMHIITIANASSEKVPPSKDEEGQPSKSNRTPRIDL